MAKKSKKEPQRHAVSPFVPAEEPSPVPLEEIATPVAEVALVLEEASEKALLFDRSADFVKAVETTTSADAVVIISPSIPHVSITPAPPAPFNIMTCSPEEATQMKQGLMIN